MYSELHLNLFFQFLFVMINGAVKSNSRSLNYFGLKSKDLPRIGIYDGDSDMKWLLPEGEISTERVRDFCQSFLKGELKVSNHCRWAAISLSNMSDQFFLTNGTSLYTEAPFSYS